MKRINVLIPIYFLMFIVIFVLPFYSAEGYSILKHTISELGAQNTPNSWIMNTTFILLGTGSIIEATRKLKGYIFFQVLLFLFGISLILAGIYNHAPILTEMAYSKTEDDIHSLFATLTGFSFTLFAIAYGFFLKRRVDKVLAFSTGISATLLSLLMFNIPTYSGVFQRIMFIISFAWLIYIFSFENSTDQQLQN